MWFEVDGVQVFAQTGGRPFDPSLQTVVMIHGAGKGPDGMAAAVPISGAPRMERFAVDLQDMVLAQCTAFGSVAESADWLIRLLDTANLETVALVGHSLGALISLDAAGRYAGRVSRAALLGVTPKMPVHQICWMRQRKIVRWRGS